MSHFISSTVELEHFMATHLASFVLKYSRSRGWAFASPWLFDLPGARGKYGLVYNIRLSDAVVVSLPRPEFYHADSLDRRERQVVRFFIVYLLSSGPSSEWDIITLVIYV